MYNYDFQQDLMDLQMRNYQFKFEVETVQQEKKEYKSQIEKWTRDSSDSESENEDGKQTPSAVSIKPSKPVSASKPKESNNTIEEMTEKLEESVEPALTKQLSGGDMFAQMLEEQARIQQEQDQILAAIGKSFKEKFARKKQQMAYDVTAAEKVELNDQKLKSLYKKIGI